MMAHIHIQQQHTDINTETENKIEKQKINKIH